MNLRPVLYVEDEEDDVFLMKRAFARTGIANPLIVVRDGQAAVDYFSGVGPYANRAEYPLPCLMLLDLNLPMKSGLDVLKWVRSGPAVFTVPVIVLTSSLQDADIHRAYIQGANAYLVKPSRPEELLAMIQNIRDFWLVQNKVTEQHWDAFKPQ